MPCVYVFSKRVGLNLEVTVGDDHGRAKDLMESTSRVFFFNYVVWNVLLVMIQNCLCHFGACYAYSYKIIWSKMVCLCYFEICQPFNAWAHTKWSISSQRAKSSISKPFVGDIPSTRCLIQVMIHLLIVGVVQKVYFVDFRLLKKNEI